MLKNLHCNLHRVRAHQDGDEANVQRCKANGIQGIERWLSERRDMAARVHMAEAQCEENRQENDQQHAGQGQPTPPLFGPHANHDWGAIVEVVHEEWKTHANENVDDLRAHCIGDRAGALALFGHRHTRKEVWHLRTQRKDCEASDVVWEPNQIGKPRGENEYQLAEKANVGQRHNHGRGPRVPKVDASVRGIVAGFVVTRAVRIRHRVAERRNGGAE
mmetsp:Transcript_16609/g.52908  ORF Transcript_16609/g.52908 Transcript_16609/m.52908 type:complete len:218 (+) Transcript_16609:285-938(+)